MPPSYRFTMRLLGGIRHWTFLPWLVSTVPQLVAQRGSDTLSICLNTVAGKLHTQ
jgi:hypothetical protein